MSQTTKEINRITTAIIKISCKLLMYVLVIFLMYEGITRGYHYGHEIFAPSALSEEPGTDREVTVKDGDTASDVARKLKEKGLIKDDFIVVIQTKFYEYKIHPGTYIFNTSMNSKDMLKLIDENEKGDKKQ